MLKTILIIALIAGAAFAGLAICAYVLKVDFAVNIMNSITTPIQDALGGVMPEEGGSLDLKTIASVASLGTAAGTAIGWVKSNKDKLIAQKDAVTKQIQNSDLLNQVTEMKDTITLTKTEFNTQIGEITALKDNALSEAEAAKSAMTKLQQENMNLQTSLDTLNTIVPSIQKEKEIIQIVK